jgi:hypothetical protein
MGPSTAGPIMACWAFGLGLAIWLAAALDVEEERCAPGEQEREGGREKERRLCQRGGVGVGGGRGPHRMNGAGRRPRDRRTEGHLEARATASGGSRRWRAAPRGAKRSGQRSSSSAQATASFNTGNGDRRRKSSTHVGSSGLGEKTLLRRACRHRRATVLHAGRSGGATVRRLLLGSADTRERRRHGTGLVPAAVGWLTAASALRIRLGVVGARRGEAAVAPAKKGVAWRSESSVHRRKNEIGERDGARTSRAKKKRVAGRGSRHGWSAERGSGGPGWRQWPGCGGSDGVTRGRRALQRREE